MIQAIGNIDACSQAMICLANLIGVLSRLFVTYDLLELSSYKSTN